MTATQFEYRHPILIHRLLVAVAFSTYLVQRDDIVWQFVKNTGEHPVLFEKIVFAVANEYVGSDRLKEWVRRNMDEKYVPLDLLKAWGFEQDEAGTEEAA